MRLRRQGAVCKIQTRRLNFPEYPVECDPIVGAEIGNRLKTRLQGPQQPDDFSFAVAFGSQPTARSHTVQIAANLEL
jgi:hypothetical protein